MLQFLSSRLRTRAQLKTLLGVMERLNAGDTGVEIPFLGDRTETGRIAATLEAFRRRLTEAEEERRRAEQASAAVRQSEARYRMLADNTADIVIQYDRDFRPLYVSPSVKSLGYEPDELLDEGILALVHPDNLETVAARREAARQGFPLKPATGRVRAADGSWVWVESTLAPMFDDAGEQVGFISTLRDIGERKLAEQALVHGEARYRMLAENITDVLLRYGADSHVEYVSPSVRQWGYEPADFIGKPAGHFVHPDDLHLIVERRDAMIRGERTGPLEIRLRRADGTWAWIESDPAFIRGPALEIIGVVLVLRDIDQRKQAQTALIESEARYRMLADNISDVLLRYDADLRVDYVSPSIRQWGYTPEDFIGQPVGVFFHPDDQERISQRRSALLRGERVPTGECRIRRADGSWIWTESNPALIRDENGAMLGIVLVLRDIDQRKQAETALVDSEARYRMLAENITDVMLRYSADQRIEYVSPSVRQWGYTPDEFMGKPAGHFVHPDDQERIAVRRAAMLQGEPAPTVEARIRRADGTWTWIESNPSAIRGADQEVIGVVLVLRDINERKAAEAALVESEARYRILADNTSDIIQRFNADGIVEYVSPSVRQLGYEPEFFIGRPTAQLVASEDLPDVVRRRQDMLSGKPVAPMESRSHTADGRTVWLESRPSSIFDEHGKLVGVVNVMRDVTERKAAESALQELNLELRRVARASALGAFAASLAHEINQPLAAAAVNGEAALRWLAAEPVNYERGLQATGRAVEAVRRAADVIGRLRALVTKEEPNRAPFDAHEAILEVLALTALEAERSSVTVHARLDAERPGIFGDRVQFQQVIINLILNAIEAMRNVDGERLLVVGSRDQAEGLEVFVEDRGPGVEPDNQALIFDSLFTTKIGGTGLGLAIAKSIIESHGGAIAMTPAAPHGAVFSVRLPRPAPRAGLRSA
jgi:PAS domain S-box-containing protein